MSFKVRRYGVAIKGQQTGNTLPLDFWRFFSRDSAVETTRRLNRESWVHDMDAGVGDPGLTRYVPWDRANQVLLSA